MKGNRVFGAFFKTMQLKTTWMLRLQLIIVFCVEYEFSKCISTDALGQCAHRLSLVLGDYLYDAVKATSDKKMLFCEASERRLYGVQLFQFNLFSGNTAEPM